MARSRRGIAVHRRRTFAAEDATCHEYIRVTTPICTLIDIAARLERSRIEAAVNEADKRGLTDPEKLRLALDEMGRRPGVRVLREVLDRRTFTLTDSDLERRFLPIARRAGLGSPPTGQLVNGFKVDFYCAITVRPPSRGRIVFATKAHAASGLTPRRFTRAQVEFEPVHVEATLTAVARRLRSRRDT